MNAIPESFGALARDWGSGQHWRVAARAVMESLWRPEFGYSAPNGAVYPWQWLWDSCFHAMIWAELGDERALTELESLFRLQTRDGMVPNIGYQADPDVGQRIWANRGASTITQPPMYGHALRVLADRGCDIDHLLGPATAGLLFFAEHRNAATGTGVAIVHPWESGADDSPRWDDWLSGDFERDRWLEVKLELLDALCLSEARAAISSPRFEVVSAGFSALVAFNCRELFELTADDRLVALAERIIDDLDARWNGVTWTDRHADGRDASAVRTLDSLLAVLVSRSTTAIERAFGELMSPGFLGTYGLAGVHVDEPHFRTDQYWRGTCWPPLMYLCWHAARRSGRTAIADDLAARALHGGALSGLAEYYDPSTAAGLGAQPQGWACLPLLMVGAGS